MNHLERLKELLGEVPEKGSLQYRVMKQTATAYYKLFMLEVQLLKDEIVEVQLTIPINKKDYQKMPLVLCNHSHGGRYQIGKKEIIEGNDYLASPPFAEVLSQLGFAAIAIDARGFGTRTYQTESELVKSALLHGSTLWGLMLNDLIYLLDFIDTQMMYTFTEIGTLGMSMGGLMSWWLAALDQRINWVIDIAGQVDLETLEAQQLLNKHGHYYYVPRLLKFLTTLDIQQMIAPRKRLSLVGYSDLNCPLDGVLKLDQGLKEIYRQMGKLQNWQCVLFEAGHEETIAMREKWVNFLKEGVGH